MKHKPVHYQGKFRKVFCECQTPWPGHPPADASISRTVCPECGYFPWVYISKADEPAPQE